MTLRLRRPSPATVIASAALFVAVGGPAEAARLINGSDIKRGTVRGLQIKDRSLTTRDLSRSTYRTLRAVPSRAVGPLQLAPGAVGPAALALNGVSGANVADGTLTGADLARNTVRASNIGGGAVGASEVAAGAIRGSEIADGTVSGVDVAAGSLTGAHLADESVVGADLAGARGTFTATVPELATGVCHPHDVTTVAGATVADDLLLVTPQETLPATLTVTASPLTDATFRVAICNLGPETVPADDIGFRYLTLHG